MVFLSLQLNKVLASRGNYLIVNGKFLRLSTNRATLEERYILADHSSSSMSRYSKQSYCPLKRKVKPLQFSLLSKLYPIAVY